MYAGDDIDIPFLRNDLGPAYRQPYRPGLDNTKRVAARGHSRPNILDRTAQVLYRMVRRIPRACGPAVQFNGLLLRGGRWDVMDEIAPVSRFFATEPTDVSFTTLDRITR